MTMKRPVRRLVRRLLRDTSANTAIITAFALTSMVGAAGLGTDSIQWTLWKRQLQRQADSAAMAGALAASQGLSASTAATAEINRYSNITLSGTPTIEVGPTAGAYTGNPRAVRVIVAAQKALPFSAFFVSTPPRITGEATASAIGFGEYCVVSLEDTTSTGVTFWGNTTVNLGCGVVTNSQGTAAVSAGGSSTITASPIAAVGAIPAATNYASGTSLQPYSAAQGDPFASLADPVVPSGCTSPLNVNSNQTRSVTNSTGTACYSSMDLKGTVNFAPGVYIINGGSMGVGAQANITGTGVTFILTGSVNSSTGVVSAATLDVNGGAYMNITAPATGTYAGMLFYQDRRASLTYNTLSGNSSSLIQGSVYFPKASLTFTGNNGMNTNCLQMVARTVTFTGSSTITNVCPSNSGTSTISGVKIRLVS